jgi:hypothetical protein
MRNPAQLHRQLPNRKCCPAATPSANSNVAARAAGMQGATHASVMK